MEGSAVSQYCFQLLLFSKQTRAITAKVLSASWRRLDPFIGAAFDKLHHEVRPARLGPARIKDIGDTGVIYGVWDLGDLAHRRAPARRWSQHALSGATGPLQSIRSDFETEDKGPLSLIQAKSVDRSGKGGYLPAKGRSPCQGLDHNFANRKHLPRGRPPNAGCGPSFSRKGAILLPSNRQSEIRVAVVGLRRHPGLPRISAGGQQLASNCSSFLLSLSRNWFRRCSISDPGKYLKSS